MVAYLYCMFFFACRAKKHIQKQKSVCLRKSYVVRFSLEERKTNYNCEKPLVGTAKALLMKRDYCA